MAAYIFLFNEEKKADGRKYNGGEIKMIANETEKQYMIPRAIGKTNVSEDGTELFTPVAYGMHQFIVKTKKTEDNSYKHSVILAFITRNNNERSSISLVSMLEDVVMSYKMDLYVPNEISNGSDAETGHKLLIHDVTERADLYLDRVYKAFEKTMGAPWVIS